MGEVIGPISKDCWLLLKTIAGPRGTIAWCKKQDSRLFSECIEKEERLKRKILHGECHFSS